MKAKWNVAKLFCRSRSLDMGQGVYPGRTVLRDRVRFQGRAGLNVELDISTAPCLAKGPNSKVLPNSRVELDSRTGSMGTETTGSKWEWDQTPAKGYIPTD